jgi:hypothetical protein
LRARRNRKRFRSGEQDATRTGLGSTGEQDTPETKVAGASCSRIRPPTPQKDKPEHNPLRSSAPAGRQGIGKNSVRPLPFVALYVFEPSLGTGGSALAMDAEERVRSPAFPGWPLGWPVTCGLRRPEGGPAPVLRSSPGSSIPRKEPVCRFFALAIFAAFCSNPLDRDPMEARGAVSANRDQVWSSFCPRLRACPETYLPHGADPLSAPDGAGSRAAPRGGKKVSGWVPSSLWHVAPFQGAGGDVRLFASFATLLPELSPIPLRHAQCSAGAVLRRTLVFKTSALTKRRPIATPDP